MKVLALDISSKTGWAFFDNNQLKEYGLLEIKSGSKEYPFGITEWSKKNAQAIINLIDSKQVDLIIVERTNSSSFRSSQSFLEYTHCFFIDSIVIKGDKNKLHYMDTSKWRSICGLKLSKEQKLQNKLAKQASKNKEILKINGKRAGKVTKKHLSVIKCNELFDTDFLLKDNDIAEACLLGWAFLNQ
jgi:hypothetical protein